MCGVQEMLYTFQAMDTLDILRRPWKFWGLIETTWSGRSMRLGPHTSSKSLFDLPSGRIDYKELRGISPEAARRAVLEYLRTNKGNICQTARLFGINRPVLPYGRMTS